MSAMPGARTAEKGAFVKTMRIHAPFRAVDEIEPLIEAGADTFYCGVRHPEASINDRANKLYFNLPDRKALEASVELIHKNGKTVAVVVNKQTLDIGRAVEFVKEADAAGTDEVILSSVTLLHALRGVKTACRFTLSCTNPVLNSEALDFFREFGIRKVCLPRHLSLGEIAKLNANKGELELEVFIMCGLCVFTEGYCGMHALPYGDEGEPCYCFKVKGVHGAKDAGRADKAGFVEEHWAPRELDGCGLCAIPKFEEMGMDSLKIEGRDEPLHDRVAYAKSVRDLLKHHRENRPDYGAYTDAAKKYCVENVGPCHPKNCYY